MAVLQEQEVKNWVGRDLDDSNGERIGTVSGLFYDETTGQAEWLLVDAMTGGKQAVVPASMIKTSADHLTASFTRDHIDQSLQIAGDETPTEDQQRFLHRYWGMGFKPMGARWRG